MENAAKRIASTIRKRRQIVGLSQEALAEKADIDRTYVSLIERGKVNITLVVASRIAKALRIPLSKLVKDFEV